MQIAIRAAGLLPHLKEAMHRITGAVTARVTIWGELGDLKGSIGVEGGELRIGTGAEGLHCRRVERADQRRPECFTVMLQPRDDGVSGLRHRLRFCQTSVIRNSDAGATRIPSRVT